MGRPRTKPDTAILEATARVFGEKGPSDLTLADVAKGAGLAPATLIQRFGSKRGLLLAITRMAAEGADACFRMVRASHRSPLKALFACFDQMAAMGETPAMLANNLAFLLNDLSDPEFRRWTLEHFRANDAGYRALLEDAIQAGELKPCDIRALARLIGATLHGSLVAWAFVQKGTARAWVRRDMERLLAPYRAPRMTRKRRSKAG